MPADRSLLCGGCQRAFLFPLKIFLILVLKKMLSMLRYRSRGKKPHCYLTTEWIKFEKDSDDVKMCNFILDKALISMVPGSYFGESGRGYARLSLGQCKERLAEAMDRLSEVMRVVKQ